MELGVHKVDANAEVDVELKVAVRAWPIGATVQCNEHRVDKQRRHPRGKWRAEDKRGSGLALQESQRDHARMQRIQTDDPAASAAKREEKAPKPAKSKQSAEPCTRNQARYMQDCLAPGNVTAPP